MHVDLAVVRKGEKIYHLRTEQQRDVIFAVEKQIITQVQLNSSQSNSFHKLLLRVKVHLKGKAYQKNTEESTSAEMCVL